MSETHISFIPFSFFILVVEYFVDLGQEQKVGKMQKQTNKKPHRSASYSDSVFLQNKQRFFGTITRDDKAKDYLQMLS